MKKIVYMGTPQFAAQILKDLLAASGETFEVVGVVTQPDQPVGRKQKLTPPPVKEVAQEAGIKVLQPVAIKEAHEDLVALAPDLLVTAAYGQIIPDELLAIAPLGNVNVHASLLPKYRGASPIHHAIYNGDRETGISLIEMTSDLDAGPIYAQASLPIDERDDTGTLFEKLAHLGSQVLLAALPDLLKGNLPAEPQDDQLATYTYPISKDQEMIDWTRPAREVQGLIRALSPDIGAYTFFQGQRLKIWKATLNNEHTELAPGQVTGVYKKYFSVACGDGGVLDVQEVQPAGKKPMPAANFLNGAGQSLEVGSQLGGQDGKR